MAIFIAVKSEKFHKYRCRIGQTWAVFKSAEKSETKSSSFTCHHGKTSDSTSNDMQHFSKMMPNR